MIFHSSEKKARFMLWTTALIWGGGFVAGKMALTGLSPWGVLFWRFGLAALLFLLPFHKAIMGQGRRVLSFGILSGVLLALSLAVQLLGLSYTTSARQSFLFTTYVAWTPFVSWLVLKKRPGTRAFAAAFLAVLGIGLIAAGGGGGNPFGRRNHSGILYPFYAADRVCGKAYEKRNGHLCLFLHPVCRGLPLFPSSPSYDGGAPHPYGQGMHGRRAFPGNSKYGRRLYPAERGPEIPA